MFLYLRNELSDRYGWANFPDENLLYSIIFAKEVPLDDDIQRYLAHSILFNSIETCLPKQSTIVPRSSLTVLTGINDEEKSEINKLTEGIYKNALEEIVKLADDGVEGIPFESFFAPWMKNRWSIATIADKKVNLAELIGISRGKQKSISSEIIKKALNTEVTTSLPTAHDFATLKANSNKDAAGHLQEIEDIFVDASIPIAVRRGAEGDKFDCLITIYRGEGVAPLRFYMDNKSFSSGNTLSVDIDNDLSKKLSQYEDVKSMCDAANVPFIYCYWTHDAGSLSMRGCDCLILREDETKDFYGPMWSLYIACRSTFSLKIIFKFLS